MSMSRFTAVDPIMSSGKTRGLFDVIQRNLGRVPNRMRIMAASPALLAAYVNFYGALAGGKLNPRLRELLAITVAEQNACAYCLSAHTAIGKGLGLSDGTLEDSRTAWSNDPTVTAALRFAQAPVAKRGAVSDEDLQRVREAGYGDAEIAEIIGHVALNMFTNYFNIAAQTEVDFPRVAPRIAKAV